MRFGGPIMSEYKNPDEWLELVRKMRYSAVYCPVDSTAPQDVTDAYVRLARENDLHIAEVGAWSNPMSRDEKTAKEAFDYCCSQLALADRIGAGCCVNIAGSISDRWDGPHEDNFSDDTFAGIVDIVRVIIDCVKPSRTFYTLELMPWMFPDSADTFLELIHAIDRKQFAVHFDPVNIICSPRSYYSNTDVIKDCFVKLAPYIKSCHAKDIMLETNLTVHLNEKRPGEGKLDYHTYLLCLNRLDKDIPLMMEHLETQEDVELAAQYIRRVAAQQNISI